MIGDIQNRGGTHDTNVTNSTIALIFVFFPHKLGQLEMLKKMQLHKAFAQKHTVSRPVLNVEHNLKPQTMQHLHSGLSRKLNLHFNFWPIIAE